MPKRSDLIDIKKFNTLKDEVCSRFGRNIIVHSDVIDLCICITTQNKFKISVQTLKRVFGLINDATIPSLYTLNVLCRYVGYPDWKCYIDNIPSLKTNTIVKKTGLSIKDFYEKEIQEFWYNYYYSCREKAFEIYNKPESFEKEQLLISLAHLPAARSSYFELFVNQDHLCKKSYKHGLKAYSNAKNTTEAILYVNGLLYLGAYLSENEIEANHYANNLSPIFEVANVFPIPIIRRSLCLLMDAEWKATDTTALVTAIINECVELNISLPAIPNVASIALQHLILAGMPIAAFELYQKTQLYPINGSDHPSHNLYLNSVKTLEALVLACNGYINESFELFITIDIARYELYFSKLYKSLYCILGMIHGNENAYDELVLLTNETGYKRLLKLAKEYIQLA